MNLAQISLWSGHDHVGEDGDPIIWWQCHVRGWVRKDGRVELRAHWEPEPTENPRAHLDGVGHDTQRAMATLGDVLDDAGIGVEK